MKDLTHDEMMAAIDHAMAVVVERFHGTETSHAPIIPLFGAAPHQLDRRGPRLPGALGHVGGDLAPEERDDRLL